MAGVRAANGAEGENERGPWFIYNIPLYGNIVEMESVEDEEQWEMYTAMNGQTPSTSFTIDLKRNRNVAQFSRIFGHYDKKNDEFETLFEEIIDENKGETVKVEVTYSDPEKSRDGKTRYLNLNFTSLD